MISVTGTLQQEAWKEKQLPPVEHIREHIWSIPVPFPDNPMRYTLSYLIKGTDGDALIVDPGWRSGLGMDHLARGFRVARTQLSAVTGIILTHYHPDHVGLAVDVVRETGAWVGIGQNERRPFISGTQAERYVTRLAQLNAWGVPESEQHRMIHDGDGIMHQFETFSSIGVNFADGDHLPLSGRTIKVVETPGHTDGHICLHEAESRTFFSGDHILPRISPHIGLHEGGSEDPLADYYESLDKLRPYGASEVLPAHEYRFRGLLDRTAELSAHHQERSAEIARLFDSHKPQNVWDMAAQLTWSRGWEAVQGYALDFALAETAAHLAYLAGQDNSRGGRETSVYRQTLCKATAVHT